MQRGGENVVYCQLPMGSTCSFYRRKSIYQVHEAYWQKMAPATKDKVGDDTRLSGAKGRGSFNGNLVPIRMDKLFRLRDCFPLLAATAVRGSTWQRNPTGRYSLRCTSLRLASSTSFINRRKSLRNSVFRFITLSLSSSKASLPFLSSICRHPFPLSIQVSTDRRLFMRLVHATRFVKFLFFNFLAES